MDDAAALHAAEPAEVCHPAKQRAAEAAAKVRAALAPVEAFAAERGAPRPERRKVDAEGVHARRARRRQHDAAGLLLFDDFVAQGLRLRAVEHRQQDDDGAGQGRSSGWYHTRDIGYIRNGQLFIAGRSSDVIIVAGRNVFPQDVEKAATEAEPTDVYLNLDRFPFITEFYPWPIECRDSFSTIQRELGCRAKHNEVKPL